MLNVVLFSMLYRLFLASWVEKHIQEARVAASARIVKNEMGVDKVILLVGVHIFTKIVGLKIWGEGSTSQPHEPWLQQLSMVLKQKLAMDMVMWGGLIWGKWMSVTVA